MSEASARAHDGRLKIGAVAQFEISKRAHLAAARLIATLRTIVEDDEQPGLRVTTLASIEPAIGGDMWAGLLRDGAEIARRLGEQIEANDAVARDEIDAEDWAALGTAFGIIVRRDHRRST